MTDLRTLLTGRITAKRALVAAGVVAAAALPGGVALATADGSSVPSVDTSVTTAAGTTAGPLSASDQQGLEYMRQEEKLAGDVYAALYDTWGLQVFANIADAEQTHQTEVAAVMALYGVDDPVDGMGAGEFVDPDLQALHDDLVARGTVSVQEALRVGALIEELDIADLRARASEVGDIDALYGRLEQGSQNHLRAFVRNLDQLGVDYVPEVLEADDFEAIIAGRSGQGSSQGEGLGRHRLEGRGHGQGSGRGQAHGFGVRDGSGPQSATSS